MPTYTAPLADIRFTLQHIAGLEAIAQLPGYEEASGETCDAILEEAARFASAVLAPLNVVGDKEGARLVDGKVVVPTGCRRGLSAIRRGRLELGRLRP